MKERDSLSLVQIWSEEGREPSQIKDLEPVLGGKSRSSQDTHLAGSSMSMDWRLVSDKIEYLSREASGPLSWSNCFKDEASANLSPWKGL